MRRKSIITLFLSVLLLASPVYVFAQSSSTNYQVNEASFGVGGDIDSNSTNYNARASIGNLGVGEPVSTTYNAVAGYITPREEYLELNITAGTADLGTLSDVTTGTANGTFYVRTYVASGYVVETMSQPPTSEGGAHLTSMTSAGSSAVGTDQFGINLVANTSPATFGSNPAPQPDSSFAFGAAASGYNTTNIFKYNVGDVVASATKGIGQTNYTVSYIANIPSLKPAGTYTMVHDLVAIPTF